MKKLSLAISALLTLGLLAACSVAAPVPTQISDADLVATIVAGTLAARPTSTATLDPNATPIPTITPTPTPTPTPEPTLSGITKKVTLVNRYVIKVPEEFTVKEILSSPTTSDPIYTFTLPSGRSFDVIVHPYAVSAELVPGKCVVSPELDGGNQIAPAFCEGLTLNGLLSFPGGIAKFGSQVTDLGLGCTANSPCPADVPADSRYSIQYTFVLPDKAGGYLLEFFAGDAFRGLSELIDGFQGLGAVLNGVVVPSLTLVKP